jgi:hypothetical protein
MDLFRVLNPMTKTEYRNYIASEWWQERRKLFLADNRICNKCGISRGIAVIAYDQDLNVHHKNYQNLGCELDEDLESLCLRCHEVQALGRSDLREVRLPKCLCCGRRTSECKDGFCPYCYAVMGNLPEWITDIAPGGDCTYWEILIVDLLNYISTDQLLEWVQLLAEARRKAPVCVPAVDVYGMREV